MTLTGRAAAQRPDVDALTAVPLGIVTHLARQDAARGGWHRLSAGNSLNTGRIDSETGAYQTVAAAMTADQRREAGLRRNGRRRKP